MYYRVCGECGAHLDPGEKCDCKKKIFFSKIRKSHLRGCDFQDNVFVISVTVDILK